MIAICGIKNTLSRPFTHKEIVCVECGQSDGMIFEVYQRYAHLFFIPLVPCGKHVMAICSNCKHVSSFKEFNSEYKEVALKDKELTKIPLWSFIGIPLLLGILWYSQHQKRPLPVDTAKIEACLNQLAANQVYEVNIGAPNSMSFAQKKMVKVLKVEDEAVVIMHGTVERFSNEELMNVPEGTMFTETPLTITKKEFVKMPFFNCK